MVKLNKKLIVNVSSYVLVALIAFSITYGVVRFRQNNSNGLVIHGPIIIHNDNDFEIYNFPGEGTFEDPYLIQNYNITTEHSESIYISGTTKHFIIQNCHLRADFKSLFIENIANNTAKIQENTIISEKSENYCISIINSNQVIMENNKVNNLDSGSWWGATTLEIRDCESTVIKNNNFLAQKVTLEDSKKSILCNNFFRLGSQSLSTVVRLYSPHVIFSDNTFTTDDAYVYIHEYNNTFSKNRFLGRAFIEISSPNSTIKDNQLASGGYNFWNYDDINIMKSYQIHNNTVATKYLGYFINSEEITISTSYYGQLYFINCKDVAVEGFNVASYSLGVAVAHSKNVSFNNIGLATAPLSPSKGIEFYNSTECEVKNSAYRAVECINVISSSNISIEDNDFGWSHFGVSVSSSTGLLISNNNFQNHLDEGISVSYSGDIQILNNTFFQNRWGISVYRSNNILASDNKLDVNVEVGILDRYNQEFEIYANSIWGGVNGIVSEYSRNSSIANNGIREIYDSCIYLYAGDNLTVNGNNCGDSIYGIFSNYVFTSILDKNEFYHTEVGIFILENYNCTISRTYSATSQKGIWITASIELLVRDNMILNADSGIYATSSGLYSYFGVISSRFENNTCLYGGIGIDILDSSNCTFESNNLNFNDNGLLLQNVEHSSVLNNSCSFNNDLGIWIQNSNNCTFRFNLLQNNTLYGASFEGCHNNTIYHNAFLYNNLGGSSQAYDDSGINDWYHIGLSEGNYWSGWNSGLGAYTIDGPGSASDLFPLDTNPL